MWKVQAYVVYQTIYLLAFHAFLRISNITGVKHNAFVSTKNLCRADVIFNLPFIHIILKWSKTIQSSDKQQIVPIHSMGNLLLCPVAHISRYIAATNGLPAEPLFTLIVGGRNIAVSQAQIRRHLRLVLRSIGINTRTHGFHTFRRSGATLAQSANVDYSKIQRHGTWRSNSIDTYLSSNVIPPSVPLAFAAILK